MRYLPSPFRRSTLRPRRITAAATVGMSLPAAAPAHAAERPAAGQVAIVGTVVGDNTQGGFLGTTGASCATSSHDGCLRYLVGPQFSSAITKPLYDRAQRA